MSRSSVGVLASGAASDAVSRNVAALVADKFASRLFAKDGTLWGLDAQSEASIRLSWVGLPRSSRPLVGEIAALRDDLAGRGLDHVVLCGMGGSSLAPEVICNTAGVDLVVLDSSDPDYVRAALSDSLERSVVVVSSKSGSTVETDSQRRAYEQAFKDAGIDPVERFVVVTDPGSPLDKDARSVGYRVINADPDVGGRYSALTAFGLVPSGLAGADIEALLDEAEAISDLLSSDDEANPALVLGAALGGTKPLRDKIILVDQGSGIVGFPDWAEQLIAESTGKQGTGLLPVVVPGDGPTAPAADELVVHLVSADADAHDHGSGDTVDVSGALGAQMLLWEAAVAVTGRLLGIDPFDQPDVESAKQAARAQMDSGGSDPDPALFTDGRVEVRAIGGAADWIGAAKTVDDAVTALLALVDPHTGYLAVMAYLDRKQDAAFADVGGILADRVHRPVTFGWGPRFLHSTGQYHKGGPRTGVYLQVTTEPEQDLAVPGRDFTFGGFIAAQAKGDASVLADHGRPVLRLHLTQHAAGLAQLSSALGIASARAGE